MEDTLGDSAKIGSSGYYAVLILVLMEDTLGVVIYLNYY